MFYPWFKTSFRHLVKRLSLFHNPSAMGELEGGSIKAKTCNKIHTSHHLYERKNEIHILLKSLNQLPTPLLFMIPFFLAVEINLKQWRTLNSQI